MTLKETIISACPEIEQIAARRAYAIGLGASEWEIVVEIELHHVLRAIKNAENISFEERQRAIYYLVDLGWNLRERLERQEPETIAFLEKLLVRE